MWQVHGVREEKKKVSCDSLKLYRYSRDANKHLSQLEDNGGSSKRCHIMSLDS